MFYKIIKIYLKYRPKDQIQNKTIFLNLNSQYSIDKILKKTLETELSRRLLINLLELTEKVK
jgi:hypothetical protein